MNNSDKGQTSTPAMDLLASADFASHVDALLLKNHVPGLSIALVQNDTISSAAFGHILTDPPRPMTADTLFDIASASKSLTAASVALFVADDENHPNVKWDAKMSHLLPDDFVMIEESYTNDVTVEDVLSHRTGLAPHDDSYLGINATHPDDARSVTRNLRNLAVAAPIRTKFMYCNQMFTVATHLVEVLSGMSFGDFLKKNFFEPLGMNSSNLDPWRAQKAGLGDRITPGFLWHEDTKTYSHFPYPSSPEAQGAGSIITSVEDYAKYVRAMMNQQAPFTKDIYQGLIRTRTFEDPDSGSTWPLTSPVMYAAGWEVSWYRGHMIVAHDGSVPGSGTKHFFVPELKFGGAAFGNADGAGIVTATVIQELIDEALNIPKSERVDWVKAIEDYFNSGSTDDSDTNGDESKDDGNDQTASNNFTGTPDQIKAQKEADEMRRKMKRDGSSDSEPLKMPLSAYTGEYWNPGYHGLKIQTKTGKDGKDFLFIDGSDRSNVFTIDLEYVAEQTKFISHLQPINYDANVPLESEFRFNNNVASRFGIQIAEEIDDLIWFDRVQDDKA